MTLTPPPGEKAPALTASDTPGATATTPPASGPMTGQPADRASGAAPVKAAVSPTARSEVTPPPAPLDVPPAVTAAGDTAELPPATPDDTAGLQRAPLPVRLLIPAIGVDAPIVPVGLDGAGNMAAPASADVTGWYNLGPRPGEPSNAIIAGHVDWLGQTGVFSLLHTLQPGDTIDVTGQAGFQAHYVVESLQAYQNETAPVAEIFGGTAGPMLTLITCAGPYNAQAAEYRDRLVVRARATRE